MVITTKQSANPVNDDRLNLVPAKICARRKPSSTPMMPMNAVSFCSPMKSLSSGGTTRRIACGSTTKRMVLACDSPSERPEQVDVADRQPAGGSARSAPAGPEQSERQPPAEHAHLGHDHQRQVGGEPLQDIWEALGEPSPVEERAKELLHRQAPRSGTHERHIRRIAAEVLLQQSAQEVLRLESVADLVERLDLW